MKRLGLVAVLVAALVTAGCSNDGGKKSVVKGSFVAPDFPTPAALANASQVIAVVQVIEETFRGEIRELPRAVFEARVVDGIKNATNDSTLRINQFVNTDTHTWGEELPEEVRPGRRYLAFLAEEFPGDQAGGDARLVGLYGFLEGVAVYEEKGPDSFELVPGRDDLGGPIPMKLSTRDIRP